MNSWSERKMDPGALAGRWSVILGIVAFWTLLGLGVKGLISQTSYIPATSTTMRIEWQDGGHAAGDIIKYDVKATDSLGVTWRDYSIPVTFKEYKRGQMPNSATAYVQAWSELTGKSSAWSIGKKYSWLGSGQTPPPPPPDTVINTPTDGMPVVYNAAELARLWTVHDGNASPTGDNETFAIYSGNSQTKPAFISASIYHPTSGTYNVRIDGRENGALVMFDGAELFRVTWNENTSTAGKAEVFAEQGWHEYRIYGHNGSTFQTGRPREFRIYRDADYSAPGLPISVDVK